MRTLNRPMFNMGGPIKQGIMHGIREPYRGGQLVRPGPGRPGYAGPKDKIATGILTKVLPKIGIKPGFLKPWGQKIKGWFGKTGPVTTTVPKQGPTYFPPTGKNIYSKGYPGGKITGTPIGPGSSEVTKQIFKPGGPLKYLQASPEGKAAKWIWDGKGWVAKAAAMPFKSPLVALGLTYTGGKWLWPDGTPASKDEIKEIKKSGGDKDYGPHTKGGSTITAEMREAKAKADKEKRINALLDTMGYDKARKNAAYDALIDAGRMVSERGTLDTKNISTELINPIVASASQRFDKPEQIREAVGLMQVKADIAKEMEDPQVTEQRRLNIEIAKKGLNVPFSDQKIIARKTMTGQTAFDTAASSTSDNFRGNIIPNAEWVKIKADIKDKSGTIDDITIITKWTNETIKGKDVPDGDYTVGDALVTIQEGQVVNVTR